MNKLQNYLCFLVFMLSAFAIPSNAQVTIGSGKPPAKAALLQLKDKDAIVENGVVVNNETSTKGGIILPRVKLTNAEGLDPFIADNQPDVELQKQLHAGLVVYNISEIAPFTKGVYYWDGKEWNYLILNQSRPK